MRGCEMMIQQTVVTGLISVALTAGNPGTPASIPDTARAPTQMVITVRSAARGNQPENLEARDLRVLQGKTLVPVVGLQRLTGDFADMELFVLLDDSTLSSSLGIHLAELKTFLKSLPTTTRVAVGYMRNGTFSLTQAFTADHQKAASSLRLPVALPGENGSTYFALSDLVEHWPSQQSTKRRAVLMFTDGVDRYYNTTSMDDPYVDAAFHNALKKGAVVYSIYLRGAG